MIPVIVTVLIITTFTKFNYYLIFNVRTTVSFHSLEKRVHKYVFYLLGTTEVCAVGNSDGTKNVKENEGTFIVISLLFKTIVLRCTR